MFGPLTGHARLEQARGPLGENDFRVRRNVIAVCVRDKSETFGLPRIEPQILRR